MRIGSGGYVVKSAAASELLPAMEAVLQGKQPMSAGLTCPLFSNADDEYSAHNRRDDVVELLRRQKHVTPYHQRLDFIPTINCFQATLLGSLDLLSTPGMRRSLWRPSHTGIAFFEDCKVHGLNIDAAIAQGSYIALHAADTLPMYMVDGTPDLVRYIEAFSSLIARLKRLQPV